MIVKVNKDNEALYNKLFEEATALLKEQNEDAEEIGDIRSYFRHLKAIINAAGDNWQYYAMLPLDEEPFYVNANTRKITIPSALKQIGVVGDNYAEIVYFKIARYFDTVDFGSESIRASIEWKKLSGAKNEGISEAWVKELSRDAEGDVLIGWPITEEMTEEAGQLKFSLRLTQFDTASANQNVIIYSFSTEPATVTIGDAMNLFQSGDVLESSDDKNIILRRINQTIVANDSFGIIDPPVWSTNVDKLGQPVEGLNDIYYLDLNPITGKLSVTLDADLTSGNSQDNTVYTWQYVNNGSWETMPNTTSTLESLNGNQCIFDKVGRYRCMAEDVVGGVSRSRSYSKEFWILEAETPVVQIATNGRYNSEILKTQDEPVVLDVLPGLNGKFYINKNKADENSILSFKWFKTSGLELEDKGEVISELQRPEVLEEGFYFGQAVVTRNKDEKTSQDYTTWRVTYPAQNPTKIDYEISGLSDNSGLKGVLVKNDKGVVTSAEKININFDDEYKYDSIDYQWYWKSRLEDQTWSKVNTAQGTGSTTTRSLTYIPDDFGLYQVKVIVHRNGDATIKDESDTKWDNAWILPRLNDVEATYFTISTSV